MLQHIEAISLFAVAIVEFIVSGAIGTMAYLSFRRYLERKHIITLALMLSMMFYAITIAISGVDDIIVSINYPTKPPFRLNEIAYAFSAGAAMGFFYLAHDVFIKPKSNTNFMLYLYILAQVAFIVWISPSIMALCSPEDLPLLYELLLSLVLYLVLLIGSYRESKAAHIEFARKRFQYIKKAAIYAILTLVFIVTADVFGLEYPVAFAFFSILSWSISAVVAYYFYEGFLIRKETHKE